MISVIDTSARAPKPAEREALTALVEPSYEHCAGLIDAEWARSTQLYLATDADGRLESIFFVAWETMQLGEETQHAVYLGQSSTREDAKNSGSVRNLYRRFVEDAQTWEADHGKRLILWYTSATPSSCLAAEIIFAEAEPFPDGSYSEVYFPVLTAIRADLHIPVITADHPFVFRGCSTRRYSISERQRIAAVCVRTSFTLLHDLGVDEAHGDRLIYICRVPPVALP